MLVHTEIGVLEILCDTAGRAYALNFVSHGAPQSVARTTAMTTAQYAAERQVVAQLEKYLQGQRREFTIPLALKASQFTMGVWEQLRRIEYGQRVAYSDVAHGIGAPAAVRAAAHAIAINPLPILIPCHRVVRRDGTIGEYATHTLGKRGSEIKKYLLDLELRGLSAI